MDVRIELESKLRELVQDSFDSYAYDNAIFFADKLLSLQKKVGNVILLSQAYFHKGVYSRALNVLQQNECVPGIVTQEECFGKGSVNEEHSACVILAARCLEKTGEWQNCLKMLSCFDPKLNDTNPAGQPQSGIADTVPWGKYRGAVHSMAGRCCEELERSKMAQKHYDRSLEADPHHWISFYRSVDIHLPCHGSLGLTKIRAPDQVSLIIKDLFSCKLSYWEKQEPLVCPRAADVSADAYLHDDQWVMPEEARLTQYFGYNNPYILFCRAERLYYGHYTQASYDTAKKVLEKDPYHEQCCALYAAALVSLKQKTDLFQLGHEVASRWPNSVLSWFVIGSYYFAVEDYDKAGKYFYKATTTDPTFLHAWIAYGHTFHALEEGEHTMTAYRNAQRLFPGCHFPALYMGIEHSKSGNLQHAISFLTMASTLAGECRDPLILNEIGVAHYRTGKYETAREYFEAAVERSPVKSWAVKPGVPVTDIQRMALINEGVTDTPEIPNAANAMRDSFWEPAIFNLGHTMRKLQRFDSALHYYNISLAICPHNSSVLTAIGFTYHLQSKLDEAIQYYHMALSVNSTQSFARDMLNKAVKDSFYHSHVTSSSTTSPASLRPSVLSAVSPPVGGGRLSSQSLMNWGARSTSGGEMSMELDTTMIGGSTSPQNSGGVHFPIQQD